MSAYKEVKVITSSGEPGLFISNPQKELSVTEGTTTYTFESAVFSEATLKALLAKTGCEGIRFIVVLHTEGTIQRLTLMAIPEDSTGETMVGTEAYVSEVHCPPNCPRI